MAEENQKINKEELSTLMFIQYISALANSGMQHLGKIMNPATGKMEKNLEGAEATIELISMLKEKTKNNLNANEESVISDALANLQLNYADEVNREEKGSKK
ncbi:DUF1844 domain-containing protein [Candidatus Omnitrophota bacterium]